MPLTGSKPTWLTFDCYGTLIQWDEGLLAAVQEILSRQGGRFVAPEKLIDVYDRFEHDLEQTPPHRRFNDVAGLALQQAMQHLGLKFGEGDVELLTSSISRMPPFPEVILTLRQLKKEGFKLCIISNTDDDIIAGNVAELDGQIDRVISAEQAQAYKPSPRIFDFAHQSIGVSRSDVVHICASPHLDLVAARDLGFRCIWIDRGTGRKPLVDYVPEETFCTPDRVPERFAQLGWL